MEVRIPADREQPTIQTHSLSSSPSPPPPPTVGSTIFSKTPTLKLPSIRCGQRNENVQIQLDPDPSPSPKMIRYRECQRNHAAHLGSHVVDGCGEFMPAGEEGTPQSLRCAACDCHRNFHRREVDGETTTTPPPPHIFSLPPPPPSQPQPTSTTAAAAANCFISFNNKPQKNPTIRPSMVGPALIHHHHHRAPVMMAFGGGAAAESSSEDLNAYRAAAFDGGGGGQFTMSSSSSKKRFRTKFTADQKEKMTEFAEKVGWRIQKQDEREVERFCEEVGVKRQVFKVWMHNNKQAIKRKQPPGD